MALEQTISPTLLASAFALLISWLVLRWWNQNGKLPPGPWGLPFFGYYPYLSVAAHKDFMKLSKIYGNVFCFRTVGGRLIIILNGYKTIRDVLVNRGDEFDGRLPGSSNLIAWMSHGMGITQEEGQPWRDQRKFFLQTAKNFGFGKMELEDRIHDEIKPFIEELRKTGSKPLEFHFHLAYAFSSVISHVLFCKKFDRDRTFTSNLSSMNKMIEMLTVEGLHMLIGLPFDFATSLPGRWKLSKGRDEIRKFTDSVVEELIQTYDPNHPKCYVDAYLQHRNEQLKKGIRDGGSFTRERLLAVAFNLFFEGTETVSSTTLSMLVELSNHPEVQKKIQQELDSVIGRERLPSWMDRQNLPYLEATILELYRVAAVFLVTTMYSNFNETTINGYRIPKRSVIVSNLYSINFDPDLFPDPQEFNPNRYLNVEGKRIKQEAGPYPFGLGKRACIGESLAQMEVFLMISSLLQSFTIPPSKDIYSISVLPRE